MDSQSPRKRGESGPSQESQDGRRHLEDTFQAMRTGSRSPIVPTPCSPLVLAVQALGAFLVEVSDALAPAMLCCALPLARGTPYSVCREGAVKAASRYPHTLHKVL